MNGMFFNCENLEKVDLSNFNSKSCTNMTVIFHGCKKLKKNGITAKDKKILESLN